MDTVIEIPDSVMKLINERGIIVDEMDGRYYNLPQWFKNVNGYLVEVPFQNSQINANTLILFQIFPHNQPPPLHDRTISKANSSNKD